MYWDGGREICWEIYFDKRTNWAEINWRMKTTTTKRPATYAGNARCAVRASEDVKRDEHARCVYITSPNIHSNKQLNAEAGRRTRFNCAQRKTRKARRRGRWRRRRSRGCDDDIYLIRYRCCWPSNEVSMLFGLD